MIRRAFTMKLKPGALTEYVHHHDNVWPELVAEIRASGIASITTFQNGLDLFLVSEIENEKAWDHLWHSDVHRRWAEVMQPLMHLTDDGIVDAGELAEIFHLETRTPARPGTRRTKKKAARSSRRAVKKGGKKTAKRGVVAKKRAAKSAKKKARRPR